MAMAFFLLRTSAMASTVSALSKKFTEKLQQSQAQLEVHAELNKVLRTENESLSEQLKDALAPRNKTEKDIEDLKEEYGKRLGSLERTIADLKNFREILLGKLIDQKGKNALLEKAISARSTEIEALKKEIVEVEKVSAVLDAAREDNETLGHGIEAEKAAMLSKVASLEVQLRDCERSKFETSLKVKTLESKLDSAKKEVKIAMSKAESLVLHEKRQAMLCAQEWEDVLTANLTDMCTESERLMKDFEEREQKLREQNGLLEVRIQELECEKLEVQSEASKCLQPLVKQIEALTERNQQLGNETNVTKRRLESECAEAQRHTTVLQKQVHDMSTQTSFLERELRETAATLESARHASHVSETIVKEQNEKILGLETSLNLQMEKNSFHKEEFAQKEKANKDAEIILLTRLQAVEHANRELKSRLNLVTQHFLMIDETTKSSSEDEENYINVFTSSRSEGSDRCMGIDSVSRGDSAFDIDVAEMFQSAKDGIGKSVELLARSELVMKEKQLVSAQRDCDQLYNDLKVITQHSEDLEGALAKSQASLKDCEERHQLALEIVGERNEVVEQLQEDLAEMKQIVRMHAELFASGKIVCQLATDQPSR